MSRERGNTHGFLFPPRVLFGFPHGARIQRGLVLIRDSTSCGEHQTRHSADMQSAAAASGNSAKPTVSGVSVTLLVSLLLPPPVTAAGSAPDLGAGAASGNWLHAQMSTKMSQKAGMFGSRTPRRRCVEKSSLLCRTRYETPVIVSRTRESAKACRRRDGCGGVHVTRACSRACARVSAGGVCLRGGPSRARAHPQRPLAVEQHLARRPRRGLRGEMGLFGTATACQALCPPAVTTGRS